jgi:hypothetical protein
MADTVTTRTLFDGDKKLITSYVNATDGTGGTTKIVDVSALNTNAKGQTCTTVTLNKVWFVVSAGATAAAQLQWDLSSGTQTPLLSLAHSDNLDFSSIGGIGNPKESNYTGDIDVVVPATAVTGETYTIICEWLKNY